MSTRRASIATTPSSAKLGGRFLIAIDPGPTPEGASSLQLDVPVEVVEPAFVEVVGGESTAVFLQLVHARAVRAAVRVHVRLSGRAPALAEIAAGAVGDDFRPGRSPAPR